MKVSVFLEDPLQKRGCKILSESRSNQGSALGIILWDGGILVRRLWGEVPAILRFEEVSTFGLTSISVGRPMYAPRDYWPCPCGCRSLMNISSCRSTIRHARWFSIIFLRLWKSGRSHTWCPAFAFMVPWYPRTKKMYLLKVLRAALKTLN